MADPTIPVPAGVDPGTWASMSPAQQIQTSQQLALQAQAPKAQPLNAYVQTPIPNQAPAQPPLSQDELDASQWRTKGLPPGTNPYPATFDPKTAYGQMAPPPGQTAKQAGYAPLPPQPPSPPGGVTGAPAPQGPVPYREAPGGDTGDLRNKFAPGSKAHEMALVDPTSQARMNQALTGVQTAIGGQAQAARDVGAAEALHGSKLAQGLSGEKDEAAANKALLFGQAKAQSDAASKHMEAADRFADDISNDKIDPDHMWSSAGIGTQIRWGAARFLGGIAQGMLHLSTNQVADQLQEMVRQDVETQKANFAARRGKLDSMYARAYRETGNAEEAQQRAMVYGMTAAAKTTESLGVASQSQVSEAKAGEVSSALGSKIAELGVNKEQEHQKDNRYVQATGRTDILHDPRVQAMAEKLQKEAGANGQPVSPDEALKRAAETYHAGSQTGNFSDIHKLPKEGSGAGADHQRQMTVSSTKEALDYLYKIRDMAKAGGELNPSRTAQGQALVAGAINAMARAETGGTRAPSEPEQNLLKKQVVDDPNAYQFSGAGVARTEQTIQMLEEKLKGLEAGASSVPSYATPR